MRSPPNERQVDLRGREAAIGAMFWCRRQSPAPVTLELWFDWASQGVEMAVLHGRRWRLAKELAAMRLYWNSPRGFFRFSFPSKHEAAKFKTFWN